MTLDAAPAAEPAAPSAAPEEASAEAIWKELEQAENSQAAEPVEPAPEAPPPPEPGAEQPKDPQGEGAAPAADATSGQAPAADDIWATAPENLRAAYKAADAKVQELEQYRRSNEGRVTSFQRKVETLERELAALKPGAAKADEPKPSKDLRAEIGESLAALSEDYPEVGERVTPVFNKLLDRLDSLSAPVRQLETKATEAEFQANAAEVARAHPDWKQVCSGQEFAEFIGSAPRYIREAFERNADNIVDPQEAADIIGRFKATRQAAPPAQPALPAPPAASATPSQPLSPKRQDQLASAAAPPPRGPARVSDEVPEEPEAAWAYFARMDEQRARGS